jgi:hypothetical protein
MQTENRHPDDLAFDVKNMITELSIVQDRYYNILIENLGITDQHIKDIIFDFVFNSSDEDESLSEYLSKFDICLDNFIKS